MRPHPVGMLSGLVVLSLLTGCGSAPPATTSAPPTTAHSTQFNIAAGQQLYAHVCYYCHGTQGQGGQGPALWGPSSVIPGSGWNQATLASFIQQNMPQATVNGVAPGSLSTAQANNVAAFILSKNK